MTHEPTRALAIGALALALTLAICGIVPDQPRAQASAPAQIIQTATPALPTLPTPAPLAPALAAPTAAPASIVSAPVVFDLAPVSAPENAAQEVAPPIDAEQVAPTVDTAALQATEDARAQAAIDAAVNDPVRNGGNVAPLGCPFPIINGVCANGVLAKSVGDPVFGSKSLADTGTDPAHQKANAVPQCAAGVDNPVCDLPVLVFTNDPPEIAPVITERDRAYSKARTR